LVSHDFSRAYSPGAFQSWSDGGKRFQRMICDVVSSIERPDPAPQRTRPECSGCSYAPRPSCRPRFLGQRNG
jgi:hypothetical protein